MIIIFYIVECCKIVKTRTETTKSRQKKTTLKRNFNQFWRPPIGWLVVVDGGLMDNEMQIWSVYLMGEQFDKLRSQ